MSHERPGRWLVFGATFFWGTSATLARHVFRDHQVPALAVVELRLLMSVLILGAWLAWRRPSALVVAPRDLPALLLLGTLGVAAIQGSYYHSISVLGVGLSILIQYLSPTLIVLYEVARGARPSARTLATVLGALAGTALLVGNVGPEAAGARPLDWVISFSSALTFSFYIVFSKRLLARYAPETILFYTFLAASIFWMFSNPPWQIARAGYPIELWVLFVVIAITSALIPFVLFYAGLRRLPPAEVGILATMEPVIAVISAWIGLGEGLAALQWLGAALVLAAAILASSGAGLGMRGPAPSGTAERSAGS